MRIVDSHHHLWNIDEHYYPWLSDQVRPVAYGDYSAIRKNYLLGDFRRDIGALDVVKSVHVQAEHDPRDPVAETRWLQQIADDPASNGFPHAIVAYVDLARVDARATLAEHMQFANMRGVRQMLYFGEAATYLSNGRWQRNLAELKRYDLSFDLQILPSQVAEAMPVITANPNIQFVLDHAGCPTPSALDDKSWAAGIVRLSKLQNISVKLSGFGMFNASWDAQSIAPIVWHILDSFGANRCLFGSNFPVDSLMKDYKGIWATFADAVMGLSEFERTLLFAKNAERIYRI